MFLHCILLYVLAMCSFSLVVFCRCSVFCVLCPAFCVLRSVFCVIDNSLMPDFLHFLQFHEDYPSSEGILIMHCLSAY